MAVPVKDQELLAALKQQKEPVELVEPNGEPLGMFITEDEYYRLAALADMPKLTTEEAARSRQQAWAEVEAGRVWTTAEAIAEAKRRAGLGNG